MNFWKLLGLTPDADRAAIRHAYAQKVKEFHPEDDPEGFAALHDAFQKALRASAGVVNAEKPQLPPLPPTPKVPAAPVLPDIGHLYEAQQHALDDFFAGITRKDV